MRPISTGRRQSPITCSARFEACAVSFLKWALNATPWVITHGDVRFGATVSFALAITSGALRFWKAARRRPLSGNARQPHEISSNGSSRLYVCKIWIITPNMIPTLNASRTNFPAPLVKERAHCLWTRWPTSSGSSELTILMPQIRVDPAVAIMRRNESVADCGASLLVTHSPPAFCTRSSAARVHLDFGRKT